MTPTQKTFAKLALPALLLLGAAPAMAESPLQPLKVAFAYDPTAPASEIYADLERTAKRACNADRLGPISLVSAKRECVQNLLDAAVQRINRAEVAGIHALTQG